MVDFFVIIISGLSGSGKSTASGVLEDMGFYCVDNIPVILLPKLLEICEQSSGDINRIALVIDIREKEFLDDYPSILRQLKEKGYPTYVIFLEADEDSIIRRFNETRRRHPLSDGGSISNGIKLEREKLSTLKAMADLVIDTSNYTVHELKKIISDYFSKYIKSIKLEVTISSFGYRFGLPRDADIVIDVRFLANPFYQNSLRYLTGMDKSVRDYVINEPRARTFFDNIVNLLDFLIPQYEAEGKTYLTISFGCTGGRHRSVAVVEEIASMLKAKDIQARIIHRDIDN